MQIISVPTVFTCKTPTAGWLNLAQVRQLQFEEQPSPVAVVTWHNGDTQRFFLVKMLKPLSPIGKKPAPDNYNI
ncbi:hypothetical protein [Nostoc piscinale]|uniref:hypothetical protein n=1 Tax=Nostoc piscinale TaxID=224012 RepID=UPI000AB1A72E|nr:hypothetical protein [Nostoc piscinale]